MAPLKQMLFGKPRDVHDPQLFHKISLIAFLAWVGLGADGLSSSAYGPDEAFRALGTHPHLAILLALATAVTVFIISFAYSRLIEHFPHGGGGYVVATKLLGPHFGVISGCALLVDYVLTITTSIASAMDQVFSFLPLHFAAWKLVIEGILILVLIIMNLRGIKESVTIIVPIFLIFLLTHAIVLIGCLCVYGSHIPSVAADTVTGLRQDVHQLGLWGVLVLFVSAYSRGAGTYTGIEAVSNGVPIMREPKVRTAQHTMMYMAASLAITAGGILLCYLLTGVTVEEGKTLNASLVERLGFGNWFVVLTLLAEAGLLVVAAQTGFIDGPRVMANMAHDGWLPRRFSSLSEQFTMYQGVLLMGAASIVSLLYTHGDITALVTMYSINVFVTFSLSQLGMCRFWVNRRRRTHRLPWKSSLLLHGIAFLLCFSILIVVVAAKFDQGAWMTLVVTSLLIFLCLWTHRYYKSIHDKVSQLSDDLLNCPIHDRPEHALALDRNKPTAVLLVSSYSGLGVHSLLSIMKMFPSHFKQIIFASIAVIDSGVFKGEEEIVRLEQETKKGLDNYVNLAHRLGLAAEGRQKSGTDSVAESEKLCAEIARDFPRAVFFGGKLVFKTDNFMQRILHNETAAAIQRRLQWRGISMVILPVSVRN